LINFEGNAQGFRLINQSIHGLKLTNATLGAFTKYPRQSVIGYDPKGKVSQKKYGFYQSEKAIFQDLAHTLGLKTIEADSSWSRHPLAFLVEAADDICYHIIDLEDGTTLGLVNLEEAVELLRPIIGERFDQEKLDAKVSHHEKLGTLRALAINELINQSVQVFIDNEPALLDGSFEESLTSLIPSAAALGLIKKVSVEKIYRAQVVLEKEIAGFEVLDGLLNTLVGAVVEFTNCNESIRTKTILRALPRDVTFLLHEGDLYSNLRVLLDYISSMTDSHALTMYRKIRGMSLPSW
jgi:dGTPase